MTDQQFCEIYSAYYETYYGEKIDHIDQLAMASSSAAELKEIIEFFIQQLKSEQ